MNKSAFLKLIQQASNISDQQTEELEKMAFAFPYCQTAHLLLAKSAYDKGSMLSTQRLRRAASYATNRQILKRVIYSTPAELVLETVAEQDEMELQAVASSVIPEETVTYSEDTTPVTDLVPTAPSDLHDTEGSDIIVVSDSFVEEVTEEPAIAETHTIEVPATTELPEEVEDTPSAEVIEPDASESELMSLLTISSLSASFTDLLAQEPDPEPEVVPEEEVEVERADVTYYPAVAEEEEPVVFELQEEPYEQTEGIFVAEKQVEQAPILVEEQLPEDAAIHYATDEIGRLYAEDALGYWMGSSRMGEQLQLKNEYTRPMPVSFHPELILEYNKTHELEKAIQPSANVLSQQLDIIEQFLKLNPRLKTMANLKIKEEPQEDLSLKSSKIKKSMASENLATIFIRQGKIKKAIKIYEQLILKNPEKKTYFAEQIEKLQNQI